MKISYENQSSIEAMRRYGRRIATKNDAEQETEVDEGVLGVASPQGPKQVQVVHQLHDGASKSVETKTNHPRIENPNEGSTAIDDQCIQDPGIWS